MTPKPQKPYPDFPLFAHLNGQWAKKIKGKLAYFDLWDDPDGALAKYQASIEGNLPPKGPAVKEKRPCKPRPDFPLRPHATGK